MPEYYYKKKRRKKSTTLYSRIIIRVTIPLFFLALIFSAIQLTSQLNTMNEVYKIESRLIFEAIQKALTREVKKSENFSDPIAFAAKLETIADFHHVDQIDIFDLFEQKPLFPKPEFKWSPFDYQGMEESVYEKGRGKPFHIKVDKEQKKLLAFIPLEGIQEDSLFIARVPFSLASVKSALGQSAWMLTFMIALIILTGGFIGFSLAHSIVKPIRQLNDATQEIVKGNLGKAVRIHTHDEIEILGETFNQMTQSLKNMKQRAEDSNPLTQLPGNQGIFHEIRTRLTERQKLVLFHIDLDRFKIFNDHYGLARGDEAIQKTAKLLKEVVEEKGAGEAFIGHQGGDDFVLVTQPQRAKEIAETIISRFDGEIVKALYRKADYDQGHTLEIDRRRMAETGEEVKIKFPLLSISLAGVSNVNRDFADYFDCMAAAVDVKKEVKKIVKSSYIIRD